MKAKTFFVTICCVVLSSCMVSQDHVSGNGRVVTKEITVESFTKLSLHCKCNVEIIQSDKQLVIIEADDNLHEFFEVDSKAGKLVVKTQDNTNFRNYKRMNVQVYINELTDFNVGIVGNITTPSQLKLDDLDLRISSVGKSKLNLDANQINIRISAVGNTTIQGKANSVSVSNSSVGNLDMKDFNVRILDASNSSVGSMHVYASEEISIRHSGVGGFSYSGDACVKSLNASGVGSVRKR